MAQEGTLGGKSGVSLEPVSAAPSINDLLQTLIAKETASTEDTTAIVDTDPSSETIKTYAQTQGLKAVVPAGFILLHNDFQKFLETTLNSQPLKDDNKSLIETVFGTDGRSGLLFNMLSNPSLWKLAGFTAAGSFAAAEFLQFQEAVSDEYAEKEEKARSEAEILLEELLQRGTPQDEAVAQAQEYYTTARAEYIKDANLNVVVAGVEGVTAAGISMATLALLIKLGVVSLSSGQLWASSLVFIGIMYLVATGAITREDGEKLKEYFRNAGIPEPSPEVLESQKQFLSEWAVSNPDSYMDDFLWASYTGGSLSNTNVESTVESLKTNTETVEVTSYTGATDFNPEGTVQVSKGSSTYGWSSNLMDPRNIVYSDADTNSAAVKSLAYTLIQTDPAARSVLLKEMGISTDANVVWEDLSVSEAVDALENLGLHTGADSDQKEKINALLGDYATFLNRMQNSYIDVAQELSTIQAVGSSSAESVTDGSSMFSSPYSEGTQDTASSVYEDAAKAIEAQTEVKLDDETTKAVQQVAEALTPLDQGVLQHISTLLERITDATETSAENSTSSNPVVVQIPTVSQSQLTKEGLPGNTFRKAVE